MFDRYYMDKDKFLSQFHNKKVLIIGDAILDCYFIGKATKINREAPVPVVRVEQEIYTGGGAANTAVNISALGGKAYFLTVIGDDQNGKYLTNVMKEKQVMTQDIIVEKGRSTATAERVMAQSQMIVRFDAGMRTKVSWETETKIIESIFALYEKVDVIIISDYDNGVLTDNVLHVIKKLQESSPKPLIIDSKRLDRYKDIGATIVKPNYQEVVSLLGITQPATVGKRAEQIQAYREKLLEITGTKYIAVTIDSEGALILQHKKNPYRTYAQPAEDSLAVGAGDTYTAALALSYATNHIITDAAEIAASACAIVVQKSGTAQCSLDELRLFYRQKNKKIIQKAELPSFLTLLRNDKKKIIFTNGCFDILHSGHVEYLQHAKQLGDILVVGVNSDRSVRKLKGPYRPINNLLDRMDVLSGLSSVDYVIPFDEDTPIKLIEIIQPDIYVKGGDYTKETLPEAPVVEAYGGTVEIMPFVINHSTSKIISRIQQVYKENPYTNI